MNELSKEKENDEKGIFKNSDDFVKTGTSTLSTLEINEILEWLH